MLPSARAGDCCGRFDLRGQPFLTARIVQSRDRRQLPNIFAFSIADH
jgi:hypothetical protein